MGGIPIRDISQIGLTSQNIGVTLLVIQFLKEVMIAHHWVVRGMYLAPNMTTVILETRIPQDLFVVSVITQKVFLFLTDLVGCHVVIHATLDTSTILVRLVGWMARATCTRITLCLFVVTRTTHQ